MWNNGDELFETKEELNGNRPESDFSSLRHDDLRSVPIDQLHLRNGRTRTSLLEDMRLSLFTHYSVLHDSLPISLCPKHLDLDLDPD